MDNKSFDDIIKSKLEQFSLENGTDSWAMFEDELSNQEFDQKVLNVLDGHEVNLPVDAWNNFETARENLEFDFSLENRLANYNNGELPSDFDTLAGKDAGSFDALIGAKLASMSVDQGSDWESFEKLLEGEEVFDQEVRRKVEDFEISHADNHWPKLSEHLEKIERRRRRVLITKFIEAAVFILFVLTIMQLYPIQQIGKKEVYRTHGVSEALRNNTQKLIAEEIIAEKNNFNNDLLAMTLIEEVPSQNNKNQADSPRNYEVANPLDLSYTSVDEKVNARDRITVSPLKVKKSSIQLSEQGMFIRLNRSMPMEVSKAKDIASQNVLELLTKDVNASYGKEDVGDLSRSNGSVEDVLLASIDIIPLAIEARNFAIPEANLDAKVKRNQYWFNIYGSPQFNMINTPYDRSYSDNRSINNVDDEIPAYSHLSDGYTLGVGISKESATLEVEGGIEYTSLNYFPKQITERVSNATFGYKDILLKEIIFDIVEFSANVKYSLFKKKGWKVYGTNGVSLGAVAFANYDIEEDEVIRPLASASIKGGTERRPPSFLDRKEFNEGLVESRNFKDNLFTTVNVGFGVSKEISDNISFYIQPTYYHNLSQGGIGPNNDVHHRLAMQIGTKVRI